MSGERTAGTVAQFEAWVAASEQELPVDPGVAAGLLSELFARAHRGGADLHDPSASLLRWLTRDLARDDAVTDEHYHRAISTLPHYLVFLRAHQLWRRSERAVQECWEMIGWAAQRPLGLTTLGEVADRIIAEQLQHRPDPTALVTLGVERGFAAPLQASLNALARQGSLTRSEVGAVIGHAPDSVALAIWTHALQAAGLARGDEADTLVPLTEVTEARGCPPPSSMLIHRVVRGLARATILQTVGSDASTGLATLSHGLIAALVSSTDAALGATESACAPGVAGVLDELAGFGLLDAINVEGGNAWLAPEPFRYPIIEAVSDVTGLVGTPDQTAPWPPVELPFSLPADTAVDLLVTFEHDPKIWRRVRVLASLPVEEVHRILQAGLGWRDVRAHVYATAEGTRRFAPQRLLGELRSDEDAAVTDSGPVRLGSLLHGGGDEIVYLYGNLANPWRLRLRVERVMSGVKEPAAWLDGAGDAPGEPSRIGEALQARLPEGWTIPSELERAWVFMERQGWMLRTGDGVELSAPGPPHARPGLVFSSGLGLEDRWGAEHPALARVVPIAGSPDDTRVALWLDDDGATRVVALPPDGGGSLLGDGAVDLLRLAAVGYPEISPRVLGRPPEDDAAAAGVEEFRRWVRGQLGVDVPDMWGPLDADGFTDWLARQGETG